MTAATVAGAPPAGLQRYWPHIAFGGALAAAWEAFGQFGNDLLLPPLTAILAALVDITLSGRLPRAILLHRALGHIRIMLRGITIGHSFLFVSLRLRSFGYIYG